MNRREAIAAIGTSVVTPTLIPEAVAAERQGLVRPEFDKHGRLSNFAQIRSSPNILREHGEEVSRLRRCVLMYTPKESPIAISGRGIDTTLIWGKIALCWHGDDLCQVLPLMIEPTKHSEVLNYPQAEIMLVPEEEDFSKSEHPWEDNDSDMPFAHAIAVTPSENGFSYIDLYDNDLEMLKGSGIIAPFNNIWESEQYIPCAGVSLDHLLDLLEYERLLQSVKLKEEQITKLQKELPRLMAKLKK